jgi:hypothetical protein
MLRLVDLVSTDNSEEPSASIITVTRIGEPGTTLAVTGNRRKATRRNIPEDGILPWKNIFVLWITCTPHKSGTNIYTFFCLCWSLQLQMCTVKSKWTSSSCNYWPMEGRMWKAEGDSVRAVCWWPNHVTFALYNYQRRMTYSVALSWQANYTDWATITCRRNLVPNLRIVGCRLVSVADPPRSLISVF